MNVAEIEIEVNGALASLRLYRDVDLAIAALESVEEKLIANFLETNAGNHMTPLKWEAADAYSRDTIKAALAKAAMFDEMVKAAKALADKVDATSDCDHKRLSCEDVGCIGVEVKAMRAILAKCIAG